MTYEEARDLLARLLHRIAPEADLTDVDAQAPLQEVIDLDSMDFLNLVTALHAETGLDVPERDYPALSSIDGFAHYVSDHAGVRP